jgi:outer membrane protein OmpA-like peptidoglycan-associated protein
MNILTVLVCSFAWSGLQAQQPATTSKKAIDAYNSGLQKYSSRDYVSAEKFFLSAIEADPEFIDAFLVLAEVYEDSQQILKAIVAYQKGLSVRPEYYPYGYVRLANLEYREARYEDALADYERYLAFKPTNPGQVRKASDGAERCRFAIDAVAHPVDFKPVNLGPAVNSERDDYWPSLSADEKTLVITRLVPMKDFFNKVQEDFFISEWNGDSWGVMRDAGGPVNTYDNEGAQSISGDGRFMVFTACNRKDGLGRCDLYYSSKEGEAWSVPKNMGSPVNTSYRETQPSLSSDGRTLYFSSDRPGGKGLHDLWVSYRQDNYSWSIPENLGDSVNTAGIEMSPFIHPDNRTLYFSSDGQIGLGGYDIFITHKNESGTWQKPVNLGYPINTNGDEIGLIVNSRGDKAYFSSDVNKANGKDIFSFDLPRQSQPLAVTYMKGKVFDASDNHNLRARCELVDLESGATFFQSFSDSISGEFLISIPVNNNYMLNVSRMGYLFFSENFSLKNTFQADQPYLKDVPLQPIRIGSTVILRNVFYETDSFDLKKESTLELDKVVRLLETNPTLRIEISGYTDNVGNQTYNQVLSENRARTVARYILSAGFAADRVVYKGYGMTLPISSNDSEEGRARNRRTELKIIAK